MMVASSLTEAWFTKAAASAPLCPMRMSSGPSRRNEKPRSAWSSCMEETPTSSTTPSAGAKPVARAMRVEIGEAPLDQLQPVPRLFGERRSRLDGGAVAIDREDIAAALKDGARYSRPRRTCRRCSARPA